MPRFLAAIGFALAAVAMAAETGMPQGVLILHSNQRPLPAGIIIDDTLRETVPGELGRPVELFSEFLDIERFTTAEYRQAQAEFLRRKYGGRNIRVIVAVAPQALQFMLDYRARALPGVPIVHLSLPRDLLPVGGLPRDVVGTTIDLDPTATFELALRLQPAAKRLVIVTGAGERDRAWERRIRDAVARLNLRLEVEYLIGLPTHDLQRRLGTLSRDTIVYTPGYFADGTGRVITPRHSVEEMASASAAPLYGPYDTFAGAGAVGGYMSPFEQQAIQASTTVARLLNGAGPETIPADTMQNVPIVDWRQLRRWEMHEELLPPGTVVRFREPSIWDRHRLEISIGIALVVLQAALIAGLLFQRRRRRRVEAELMESQQLMEQATSAGEFGMWARDLSTGSVWVNPALRTLFGFGQKDVLQMIDLIARIHAEDRPRVTAGLKSAQDSGKPFEGEFRAVLPGGMQRWVLAKGRTIGDARYGSGRRRMGVVIDITERKQSDDLLKKERAFLRQVIDIAPNLIFAKDRDGRFTLANQAVAEVFGTTVENVVGRTDSDFNPNAAEVEHFRRVDREVMDTLQERFVAEESITSAGGKTLWLQTVKRPLIGEDGRASQVLGSATDISRRKQAELELAQQRYELAHLLRVAMLGELSGSLAHELNQPLTAILSNAQAAQRLLGQGAGKIDEVGEILKDIVADDRRAGEVIKRLRALLRKDEVQHHPLDVNDVVLEVLKVMRGDLLNRNVTVSTELAAGLPRVDGDRVHLQQVLLNLLINGCDAMEGTPGDRRLMLRTAAAAGGEVEVSVADRGSGIPPEDLERIFEPFVSTKAEGLGLGLAVCRTIVAAHHGRLWATNNADRGASFHFTLQVKRELLE